MRQEVLASAIGKPCYRLTRIPASDEPTRSRQVWLKNRTYLPPVRGGGDSRRGAAEESVDPAAASAGIPYRSAGAEEVAASSPPEGVAGIVRSALAMAETCISARGLLVAEGVFTGS